MNNYECHYKDKIPTETIKNIKQFFKEKNLKIEEKQKLHSEINTYSCHIMLLTQNDEPIMFSNGKGLTEEYSLASGYAELYERFCNGFTYVNNAILYKYINKEKEIFYTKDFIDLFKNKNSNEFNFLFSNILKREFVLYKKYYDICFDEKYFEFKYKSILDDNKYALYNPYFILKLRGSTGMVAGNTLEEALNQGISELFERYVHNNHFTEDKNQIYHVIDLNKIKDLRLKSILQKIEKMGHKIYVIDFSYTYGVPVLMSVLINKDSHNFSMNYGSFPIFEIALERVLTETYQGIKNFHLDESDFIQEPSKESDIKEMLDLSWVSSSTAPFFNENILFNLKENCEPNKEIFLFKDDKDYTNKDILEYYKNLCRKLNIDFLYTDNSESKDVFALQLYSEELFQFSILNEINFDNIKYSLKHLIYLKEFEKKILYYQEYDFDLLYKSYQNFCFLQNREKEKTRWINIKLKLESNHSFSLFNTFDSFNFIDIIYDFLYKNEIDDKKLYDTYKETFLEKNIRKYLTLHRYLRSNKYIDSEKKYIINFLGLDISEEDFLIIKNKEYFIQKMLLEPFHDYYYNKYYQLYINNL